MVHGGGHHRHSAHTGAGRVGGGGGGVGLFSGTGHVGRARTAQASNRPILYPASNTTNVFVQQSYPWWTSMTTTVPYYRQYRRDSISTTQSRASSVDDDCNCHDCCRNCWCCIISCVCCCYLCPSHQSAASQGHRNDPRSGPLPNHDERSTGPSACTLCYCPSTFLSIVLFLILLSMSSLKDEQFTINVGESRRIHLPFLSQVTASSSAYYSDSNDGAGLRFYTLSTSCPPLTGPAIVLNEQRNLILARDDYQYDYFYLQPGSVLDVQVAQSKGSTNVYLLKGQHGLNRVEEDDDNESIGSRAILKRFVTSGWDPVRFRYRVTKENVYTLVYDNASNNPAVLAVTYNTTLTTYNLEGQEPTCNEAMTLCSLDRRGNNCVIVQAVSTSVTPSDETVTVELENHRKWMELCILTLAPILLQITFSLFASKAMQRKSESLPQDLPSVDTPTIADSSTYGSVIDAPQQQHPSPSAPSELEDDPLLIAPVEASAVETVDPTIPFVSLENIVPIQPPSTNKAN